MKSQSRKYLDDVRAEQLADAIADEKKPRMCNRHPEPVFYDELRCPCCALTSEIGLRNLLDDGKENLL